MTTLTTSKILSRLAHGELSVLKMATGGVIAAGDRPKVLIHLNDALTDIFTRFLLSKKEVIINSTVEATHYFIRYEYAASNVDSEQPNLYLDDSGCEGFDGRIVKILNVFDAFGRELFMNKAQEPLSVFTPQHDCLQITANHQSEQFWVIFQALHPIINYNPAPASPVVDTVINIPPSLERPLMLLTASKIFSGMTGQPNLTKSAMLNQEYELAVAEMEFRDSGSTSENMSNGKLEKNGFV